MSRKFLFQSLFRQSSVSQKGFTLTELLVAALMAGIFLAGTAKIMIDILTLEKRESARENAQSELTEALDFIATELSEAVYVYTGQELEEKLIRYSGGGDKYIPQIGSSGKKIAALPIFQGFPVLAFWKLQSTHGNCTNARCVPALKASPDPTDTRRTGNLRDQGYTYVLVIYYLRSNNESSSSIWHPEQDGPSRIQRYVVRPFSSDIAVRGDYVGPSIDPPGLPNFSVWPGTSANPNPPTRPSPLSSPPFSSQLDNLIGFVNHPRQTGDPDFDAVQCPLDYEASPRTTPAETSLTADSRLAANDVFYACVREHESERSQDVIIYLRGNALDIAGLRRAAPSSSTCDDDPTLCPQLQTRVFVRGFFGKDPTS
jgi:prepilin-type N-terminal cleavage/methylation domain-containing protein